MGAAGILFAAARMIAAPRRATDRSKGFGSRLEHDLAEFSLRSERALPFQVDGDALDERRQVRFRSVPRALEVYV
jgi:diacylglycerol kinase family enzyme